MREGVYVRENLTLTLGGPNVGASPTRATC